MNSNNQATQDYSKFPVEFNWKWPPPLNNNNMGMFNNFINIAATSAPQNVTFEFYLPLPNDTRIYTSHIPNYIH